jgi:DNA-binding transcriptional LysR family regulator
MDRSQELKVFVTVAETGGFAKAAERLGSSPPAVTRIIAGLEQRLSTQFFARTTRRVHLTEAGKLFLERARSLLSELESVESEITGEARMPTGRLTITASVTLGRSMLPPVVMGFLNAHSRITAKVLLLDRVVNLVEEGIDVAVRIGELPDSTLISRQVGEVRRILVASPGYLAQRGTPKTAADLKLHAMIAFTGLMPNNEWTYIGERGASRVTLQPRFEINDATAAIAAAEAGSGITIALSYMVAKPLREGSLVPVLMNLCPPAVPVQLVYPESRLVAPKVRAFIDYAAPRLRAALQEVGTKTTKAKS